MYGWAIISVAGSQWQRLYLDPTLHRAHGCLVSVPSQLMTVMCFNSLPHTRMVKRLLEQRSLRNMGSAGNEITQHTSFWELTTKPYICCDSVRIFMWLLAYKKCSASCTIGTLGSASIHQHCLRTGGNWSSRFYFIWMFSSMVSKKCQSSKERSYLIFFFL